MLSRWRQEVVTRMRSPWPGPRPMRSGRDDPSVLVGREADARSLARLVYDTDVVVFTGPSGVGKTSMLQLQLVPTLTDAGYKVVVCDDWSRSGETATVDDFVQRQATEPLPAAVQRMIAGGSTMLDALDALYPDRSVIVLDQFEELIRYQRREYQKVLRWIEHASTHKRVRIVVSLRVEHEHELRGHSGLRVGPFQQARYELKPITDRSLLRDVIAAGRTDDGRPAVDDEATEHLLDAWEAAGGADGQTDQGLLHLQALLFVLWTNRQGDVIRAADLEALSNGFATAGSDDADADDTAGLFPRALAYAVEVALEKCSEACLPDPAAGWSGLDPVLVSRTRGHVRAMSRFLSSGGYKVSLAREELAREVILREVASGLAECAGRVEAARQRLADLVDASTPRRSRAGQGRPEIPDWLGVPRSELFGAPPPDGLPWELDANDVTSGVLLGRRPEDSLLEEYRGFYFAIEWLRLCDLVRLTTPYRGKTMVTLIHDLFGGGLVQWSRLVPAGLETTVNRFTAVRGAQLPEDPREQRELVQDTVIANARWTVCRITADFRNVTFVNCDFRGTTFVDCLFEGAAFVNCMLDDAEFLGCRILGAAGPAPQRDRPLDARRSGLPEFYVPYAPQGLLRSLDWHREPREEVSSVPAALFSWRPVLPAVPVHRPARASELVVRPPTGGLSLHGGRVSSLKVRSCDFEAGGSMALRSVAGTSVEFADQTHVRLVVHGAAIRGLSITRPVQDAVPSPRPDGPGPAFDVSFVDSRVVSVWFGVGLVGRASFTDCLAVQVFNAADQEEFSVTLPDSAHYGVVNADLSGAGPVVGLAPDDLGDMRAEVRAASQIIDYRRRPLPSELVEDPDDA